MRSTNRIIAPFVLLLAVGLLVALLMPSAISTTRASQATMAQGAPSVTSFKGIQEGQAISGKVTLEAVVAGSNIAQVVFQINGPKSARYTDRRAPYFFKGDDNGTPRLWNTTRHPDGNYTLTATATNKAGQASSLIVHFRISNTNPPAPNQPPTPTATLAPTAVPAATPIAAPPGGQILWSADHETGDFSQWFPVQAQDGGIFTTGSGTASISTDVAHSGQHAAKLTISNANGQNGNEGVRLFRFKESRSYHEAYYSAWFYFPQRYVPPVWWNLFQFKSVNATHNDAFWQLNGGNRADGSMYFYLINWVNQKNYDQTIKNIPVGQWTHVEVYYKQSISNTGHITVWQDSTVLFDLDGITTGFADAIESANWSINSYTDNISPSQATIYVDDAMVSTYRVGP